MTVRQVVMVGSFPPPVGGAALVNQMVFEALKTRGAEAVALDISGPALAHSRSLGYHAQRARANWRAGKAAHRLAAPENVLYVVPDAGAGAWYTAGILRAAANKFGQIVIHHHSCRYIEEHSRPMALLTDTTRSKAVHVFLTDGMATSFADRYGTVNQFIATNARFVAEEAATLTSLQRTETLRLGHLSNLCADKGFFIVADTFDAIRASGQDATLLLAGPALDDDVISRIDELRVRHGERVTHVGKVSGTAKRDIYRAIDIFLFPTQFRQEAAPLVVYEALAAGVPVLATDRGVIREVVTGIRGAVCPRNDNFTEFVRKWIIGEAGAAMDRQLRAAMIQQDIRQDCAYSIQQYDALLDLLTSPLEHGS
jgi:glycosyltransferase involved in cell wall biosynthesis